MKPAPPRSAARASKTWLIAGAAGAAIAAASLGIAAAAQAGDGLPTPANSDDALYQEAVPQESVPSLLWNRASAPPADEERPADLSAEEMKRLTEEATGSTVPQ